MTSDTVIINLKDSLSTIYVEDDLEVGLISINIKRCICVLSLELYIVDYNH
jgi:hypothetical protein